MKKIIGIITISVFLGLLLCHCKTSKEVHKESFDSTSVVKEDKNVHLDSVNVKTWDRETVIEYALEDKSLSWMADLRDSVKVSDYYGNVGDTNGSVFATGNDFAIRKSQIKKITIREKGKDSTVLSKIDKSKTVQKTQVGTFVKDKDIKRSTQWGVIFLCFSLLLFLIVLGRWLYKTYKQTNFKL